MKKINAINKHFSDCTHIPAEDRDSDTLAYLSKHIAKLPDANPVKSVCMRLLAGEEVEGDDITPFLEGIKQNKRFSPISFLCIWALGRMRLCESNAIEASKTLAKVYESQFLASKSRLLFRNFKQNMFYSMPSYILIVAFLVWQLHIISNSPPLNSTVAAAIHFENTKYSEIMRVSEIEFISIFFAMLISTCFIAFGTKSYVKSRYREELISSMQFQKRPETVSTLIGMYFRTINSPIGPVVNVDENHLKTLLEIMTMANEQQITYNGSLVMKRFGMLIQFLNSSTLDYTSELMSAMLETVERTGDSSLVPVLIEVSQTNPYPFIRDAAHRIGEILIKRSSHNETLLRASQENESENLLRGSNPLQRTGTEALLKPVSGSISTLNESVQNDTLDRLELNVGDGKLNNH